MKSICFAIIVNVFFGCRHATLSETLSVCWSVRPSVDKSRKVRNTRFRCFWAAAPKGSMTYAFTLLLLLLLPLPSNPSLEAQILVSRTKSQSGGPNPHLEAQILASRPKSLPGGLDPSLEAQISSLRLGSWPLGCDLNL